MSPEYVKCHSGAVSAAEGLAVGTGRSNPEKSTVPVSSALRTVMRTECGAARQAAP